MNGYYNFYFVMLCFTSFIYGWILADVTRFLTVEWSVLFGLWATTLILLAALFGEAFRIKIEKGSGV